jgi:hypothetical protein
MIAREGRRFTARQHSQQAMNDAPNFRCLRNPNPLGVFRRPERLGDLGDLAVRQVSPHHDAEGYDRPQRDA